MMKLKRDRYVVKSTEFKFIGKFAASISTKRTPFLIGLSLVSVALFYFATKITFDYNYLNMEPEGLTSIKLQHQMEDEFDVTPDFAMITSESIEGARRLTESAKDLKMVGMVTSISEYIPSPEQQINRKPYIQRIQNYLQTNRTITPLYLSDIQQLKEEVNRLEDNVIELAQLAFLGGQDKVDTKCKELIGDLEKKSRQSLLNNFVNHISSSPESAVNALNRFHDDFEPTLRKTALNMANTNPITLEMLPDNIRNQFENKAGNKYLVTIYPKEGVWNLKFLEQFTNKMQTLDARVTGIPLVFYVLIQKIAVDGRNAAMLTLLVIFLLLWWDFRRLKLSLLAMIPLLLGAIWMVGTMFLSGLQLTMVNLMGLPLILGIGIDDGVHILHRYRFEGNGNLGKVFTSTGKAVLLTSLTTMLAFGSLVFATYRGLGSLGIALFIGVGTCFLTTILVLPAMLGFFVKKNTD